MFIASIIAHFLLISILFYKKVWEELHWLALIAILGLGFTVLFHLLDPSTETYFNLFYGVNILMAVLYALCIFQLWKTPVESIEYSQALYLVLKFIQWFFAWRHMEDYRVNLIQFMRPLNLVFILLWVWAIARYDEGRKEPPYDSIRR